MPDASIIDLIALARNNHNLKGEIETGLENLGVITDKQIILNNPTTSASRIHVRLAGETTTASKWKITDITDSENPVVINDNITDNSYTITGLTNDIEREYLVQAYIDGNWTEGTYVFATPHIRTDALTPQVKIKPQNRGVFLSWEPVPGATKYAINAWGSKYNIVKSAWTDTTLPINQRVNGAKHSFLVQAYVNGTWHPTASNTNPARLEHVSAIPTITSVGTDIATLSGDGTITLSWSKNAGDDGEMLICVDRQNSVTPYANLIVKTGMPLRSNGTTFDVIRFPFGVVTKRIDTDGSVLANSFDIPLTAKELEDYATLKAYTAAPYIYNNYNTTMQVSYVKKTDGGTALLDIIADFQRQIDELDIAVAEIGGVNSG